MVLACVMVFGFSPCYSVSPCYGIILVLARVMVLQAHSLTIEYSTSFVQKILYFLAALGKELNLSFKTEFHDI